MSRRFGCEGCMWRVTSCGHGRAIRSAVEEARLCSIDAEKLLSEIRGGQGNELGTGLRGSTPRGGASRKRR